MWFDFETARVAACVECKNRAVLANIPIRKPNGEARRPSILPFAPLGSILCQPWQSPLANTPSPLPKVQRSGDGKKARVEALQSRTQQMQEVQAVEPSSPSHACDLRKL